MKSSYRGTRLTHASHSRLALVLMPATVSDGRHSDRQSLKYDPTRNPDHRHRGACAERTSRATDRAPEPRRAALQYLALGLTLMAILSASTRPVAAQSVGFTEQRPFIIGYIPIVGRNGAVGGVSVSSEGVLDRARATTSDRLRDERLEALKPVDPELQQSSRLRKVSLRGLERRIAQSIITGDPLPDAMHFLAGLQRIDYVFVYPDAQDIVIAGYAEGWSQRPDGDVVGSQSGRPVLRLDDLLSALRSVAGPGPSYVITCSIDPTEEGLQRVEALLRGGRLRGGGAATNRLKTALGPQHITLTGIAPDTHFARVLVEADFMMKRLAMGMERTRSGLPSYLDLLQNHPAASAATSMPRWWLASEYEPPLRDPEGLAWQIRGPRVRTWGEGGRRAASVDPLVQQWAEEMSERYPALAEEFPVFAKLEGCMDLALVACIIEQGELRQNAGCDLRILTDSAVIAPAPYTVPKTVSSQASMLRTQRGWIVSLSGGTEVDPWTVVEQTEVADSLPTAPSEHVPPPDRWWWD